MIMEEIKIAVADLLNNIGMQLNNENGSRFDPDVRLLLEDIRCEVYDIYCNIDILEANQQNHVQVSPAFKENLICSIIGGITVNENITSIKFNKDRFAKVAIEQADEIIKQINDKNE